MRRMDKSEYKIGDMNVNLALERYLLYFGGLIRFYSGAMERQNFDLASKIETEMDRAGRRFCELSELQLKLSGGIA